jgi:hypothetical protein
MRRQAVRREQGLDFHDAMRRHQQKIAARKEELAPSRFFFEHCHRFSA